MKFEIIRDAYDMGSMGYEDSGSYLNRKSGRVLMNSMDGLIDEDGNYIDKDELCHSEWICLPDKMELNLGKRLVFDFVRKYIPELEEKIHYVFKKRGAYSRFKDILSKCGQLENWFAFEEKRTNEALIWWCEDNDILLEDIHEPINLDSISIEILQSSKQTDGCVAIFKETTQPDAGPPLHKHLKQTEVFHVLEGIYKFQVDKDQFILKAGDCAVVKPGQVHSFQNINKEPSTLIFELYPAMDADQFFYELEKIDDKSEVGELFKKYQSELM